MKAGRIVTQRVGELTTQAPVLNPLSPTPGRTIDRRRVPWSDRSYTGFRDSGGQPVSKFEEWESEVAGVFEASMNVLNSCRRTVADERGSALISDADQARAVARNLEEALAAHPCPAPDLGLQLTRLARSFLSFGNSLEVSANWASIIDWKVIDREVRGLHLQIAQTLVMMNQQSLRKG